MTSVQYLKDFALDVSLSTSGLDEGRATDGAGDSGCGLAEDDLLVSAVGALDLNEFASHVITP